MLWKFAAAVPVQLPHVGQKVLCTATFFVGSGVPASTALATGGGGGSS